jgi:transcriptional regulator with XRE-family HTH domain
MFENGLALRKIRSKMNISLKKIKAETGIADSKMSRIENNTDKTGLTIEEAYRMSKTYEMGFLQFLLEAEFISTEEINQYRADFSNMELLSDNDKAFIQQMINYIVINNAKERDCNNEI